MAVDANAGDFGAYGRIRTADEPGVDAVAITPSDTVNLTVFCRKIWVGGTGNITLVTLAGNTVTFAGVPVGEFKMGAQRVNATNTSATSLVAIY